LPSPPSLRISWPQTPWLKGHAFGNERNLLVHDVETNGGIVSMGHLFSVMDTEFVKQVRA